MAEKQEVTSAVVQRFLPATASVYLGVLAASAIVDAGALSWFSLAVAAGSTALITAGFGIVAGLLGPALPPLVRTARRSLVAGFAAPLTVGALSAFTQGATIPAIAVLTFAAGALAGVVSLGPSVLGRGEEKLDPDVLAELERLEAELAVTPFQEHARLDAGITADPPGIDRLHSRRIAEGAGQTRNGHVQE